MVFPLNFGRLQQKEHFHTAICGEQCDVRHTVRTQICFNLENILLFVIDHWLELVLTSHND